MYHAVIHQLYDIISLICRQRDPHRQAENLPEINENGLMRSFIAETCRNSSKKGFSSFGRLSGFASDY